MNKLPTFFNYNEEGKPDYGYEAIQDFFLSWTLRCAEEKYHTINAQLNRYAKRLAYALCYSKNIDKKLSVHIEDIDKLQVLSVKTKRQFQGIDLLVEIELINTGIKEKILLNIENKWYTTIRKNQLINYIKKLESSEYSEWKTINWVIYCDNEKLGKPELKQIDKCIEAGYSYTHIDELKGIIFEKEDLPTENYMFDEYWFRF